MGIEVGLTRTKLVQRLRVERDPELVWRSEPDAGLLRLEAVGKARRAGHDVEYRIGGDLDLFTCQQVTHAEVAAVGE